MEGFGAAKEGRATWKSPQFLRQSSLRPLVDRMALSLLTRLAPKAARKVAAPKPMTRKYSSHSHHVEGPIEKITLKTRVVFPSPIGRSNVAAVDVNSAVAAENEHFASITPEKQQGTVPSTRSTVLRSSRGTPSSTLTFICLSN